MNSRRRLFLAALILPACLIGIAVHRNSEGLPQKRWSNLVPFGFDLDGGNQIVLQVQWNDLLDRVAEGAINRLRSLLADEKVSYTSMSGHSSDEQTAYIDIRGIQTFEQGSFLRLLSEDSGRQWRVEAMNATDFRLQLRPEAASKVTDDALKRAMDVVRRKADALGLSQARVQQLGAINPDILLQFRRVDDMRRVKSIIQTPGALEIKVVQGGPFISPEAAVADLAGGLPADAELMRRSSISTNRQNEQWWLVTRSALVNNHDLRNARAQQTEWSTWEVVFMLAPDAAQRVAQLAGRNAGGRFAIVLDGAILSTEKIEEGPWDEVYITDIAGPDEAEDLALSLRAGSLPAALKIREERMVGSPFGADSMPRGTLAIFACLVLSFVVFRRRRASSPIPVVVLTIVTVNALVGSMSFAWTAPAITGLLLSIAIAVSSLLLIRSTIGQSQSLRAWTPAATGLTFEGSFPAVRETHLAGLIGSGFLLFLGNAVARDIAVPLTAGLITSLVASFFALRRMAGNPTLREHHDGFDAGRAELLPGTSLALALSAVVILPGIVGLAWRGAPGYGADFQSAVVVRAEFRNPPQSEKLRRSLVDRVGGEISVQRVQGARELMIGMPVSSERSFQQAKASLKEALLRTQGGDGGLDIRTIDLVGPWAGSESRQQLWLTVLAALAGMLAFVSFRFNLIHGTAVAFATLYDAIVIFGVLSMLEHKLTMNTIAAITVVLVYSVIRKVGVLSIARVNSLTHWPLPESMNLALRRFAFADAPILLAALALFACGPAWSNIALVLSLGILASSCSSNFVLGSILAIGRYNRSSTLTAENVSAEAV